MFDLLSQAGYFGSVAVGAGLLGLAGAALALVLSLMKKGAPAVIWVVIGGVPLLIGFVGALAGAQQVYAAAPMIPPENSTEVMAHGLATSVVAIQVGAWTSALVFLCLAWACALGLVARPGPGSKIRLATGGPAATLVVLIALVIAFAGWSLPTLIAAVLTLGLAPAVLLGALRWPEKGEDIDKLRVAGGRIAVSFLAALSVLSSSTAVAALSWSETLMCATVPGVQGERLLAECLWLAWWSTGLGVVATGLTLPLIAIPLVTGRAHLTTGSGIRGVLAFLPLLAFPLLAGTMAWLSVSILSGNQPVYVQKASEIRAQATALPSADLGPNFSPVPARALLFLGADGPRSNGQAVRATDLDSSQTHAIVAPGSTPLDTLVPWLDPPSCLIVDSGELTCVRLSLGSSKTRLGPDHNDIEVTPTDDGFVVRQLPHGEPSAPISRRELPQQIRGPADGIHDHTIWLKASPTLTVGDYVAILEETWATISDHDQPYSRLQLQLVP